MDGARRQTVLGVGQQRVLVRLAACIVPETAGAAPEITRELLSAIDAQLQLRPRLQQLEFKLLLLALSGLTLLPGRWQEGWLLFLEGFPLRLVRVGIWGLKTLIFLGYYGQESVDRQIRYFPSKAEGNVRLHARRMPSEG